MNDTVALHVPEELYQALQKQASKTGQKPDTLAIEWLTEAIQHARSMEIDPLVQLFGTLQGDTNNIGDHHDKYIGQSLAGELRNHE